MTDEEILNDNSISYILDEFRPNQINESLNTLSQLTAPEKVIESERHSRLLLYLSTISTSLMVDTSEVSDLVCKDKRYKIVVDVYIWLLNNYKSIGFT